MYTVQGGDSLWRIASRQLGDPSRWTQIATLNHLRAPSRLLVGQQLFLPVQGTHTVSPALHGALTAAAPGRPYPLDGQHLPGHHASAEQPFEKKSSLLPARAHLFFLMDEFDPFTKKFTRKVGLPRAAITPEEAVRILNPEKYGITARAPLDTKTPIGRHVLGSNKSRFTSASDLPAGSPRIEGETYWIDVAKAKAAGVVIHDGDAIMKDLDRIAAKTKDPAFKARIEKIRGYSIQDREVLLENHIPAGAVKGLSAMRLTRGLRVVEGVGLVFSAYDMARAGQESYQAKSIVPLTKETVRQAGGWAGAWAGAEIGGAAGAAVGIETGPGAIITGAVGALIFGTAGFLGADWATRRMFKGK